MITSSSVASSASVRRSEGTWRWPLNVSHMIPRNTAMMMMTTGVRFARNAPNPRPAADPIMMLGGSPIRVAVPPMLELRITATR